jgi:hypothetical protein
MLSKEKSLIIFSHAKGQHTPNSQLGFGFGFGLSSEMANALRFFSIALFLASAAFIAANSGGRILGIFGSLEIESNKNKRSYHK